MNESNVEVPGYAYDQHQVAKSPVTGVQLEELKASVMFSEDDRQALLKAGDILEDQVHDVLDVWSGFIADQPHLLAYFSDADGQPIREYRLRVRARFEQWILDTCRRPYDQYWLDYQEEIGQRHGRAKKNQTDGVVSPSPVPLRLLIALIYPITATIRPFLAAKGNSDDEVETMWRAWSKAVTIQVALWSRSYARNGDW